MLNNKTILVTGANGGLGRALCTEFASKGANIIFHDLRPSADSDEWQQKISNDYKVNIQSVYCDLLNQEATESAINKLADSDIVIDGLVNCAGIAHGGYFQMTPISDMRRVFEINFFALAAIMQIVLRHMVRNGKGSIVNIGSTNGIDLQGGQCAYGVSKAAVMSLTKTVAAESAGFGVRVNAIAPSIMNTEMGKNMDKKAYTKLVSRSAMKRLVEPEEIAKTAAFLLSDESAFINGEIIVVDGGKA